jgi:UPF0755 protein
MKKNNIKLSLIFIPLFTFIITVAYIYYLFLTKPVNPQDFSLLPFSINRGETIDNIGFRLEDSGLIKSQAVFKFTVTKLGLAKKIQAGQFQLSPSWNIEKISQALTSGRDDFVVTLVEGLRREEYAQELAYRFSQLGLDFDKKAFMLQTEGKEGYLFPDTYYFPKGYSSIEVARLLTDTFNQKINDEYLRKIDQQNLTLKQAIIIASMVEREAKLDKDRPYVAGIITKRLKNGWKLQIDATVQYALGFQPKENTWWKQNLTLLDLEYSSPYNTYLFYGLPPAPICNPSESSINAVANQTQTNYWYYISDTNGELRYAETITEHNQNISKYLGK